MSKLTHRYLLDTEGIGFNFSGKFTKPAQGIIKSKFVADSEKLLEELFFFYVVLTYAKMENEKTLNFETIILMLGNQFNIRIFKTASYKSMGTLKYFNIHTFSVIMKL